MSNPLDDALQVKEAFLGGLLGATAKRGGRGFFRGITSGLGKSGPKIGESIATGAAGALGAGALAAVGVGAQKVYGAATKKRQFSAMMDANPDLATQHKQNPKFFNTAYNSMRSVNPSFGSDPVVGGSLMRRMMESPETAGTILMSTTKAPQAGFSMETDFGPLKYRRNL